MDHRTVDILSKPLDMTPFPDDEIHYGPLLTWDEGQTQAKHRLQLERRTQIAVKRKAQYQDAGFNPFHAWCKAVNDLEPLDPSEWQLVERGDLEAEDFWKDMGTMWRQAMEYRDQETLLKLMPVFARKLEPVKKGVDKVERSPEEAAEEALAEAERLTRGNGK